MQTDFEGEGVRVLGVTKATAGEVEVFRIEQLVNYPILAEAGAVFDAWGVKATWGSVVYLVDRNGRVVTRGIDEIRAELER